MRQYAWLELEGNTWHFLTCLTAEPEESNRCWTNQRCALMELGKEGWSIVRPYPRLSSMDSGIQGYGLSRDNPERAALSSRRRPVIAAQWEDCAIS